MESNFVGSFIKMDPAHNSNRMNMFTRFCVNTDVAVNVGRKIIIPDEECNQIKYKLWFDDFPDGCGECGLLDHIFDTCPNRANPIPTLQVIIKKSNSIHQATSSNSQGWNDIGKNNKVIPNLKGPFTHQNKPYLSEKSGINIVYESEESDELLQVDPPLENDFSKAPNLIPASVCAMTKEINWSKTVQNLINKSLAADQGIKETLLIGKHSECLILSTHCNENYEEEQDASNEFDLETEPLQQNYILDSRLPAEMILQSASMQELVMLNNVNVNQSFPAEDPQYDDFDDNDPMNMDHNGEDNREMDNGDFNQGFEQYYEEDEEPFEDIDSPPPEEPEPEVQPNSPSHPTLNDQDLTPLRFCSDPPYSEKDIENFLYGNFTNPPGHPGTPENSFHSTHNSLQSSSSMIMKIDNLGMNNVDQSTSNSSKRKINEGIYDTASYDPMVHKKPKC